MNIVANMDTESRPIKWIHDEFKKGNLFVDESFQRNYIWIKKDRIALIETIILGYPIPEIYLWETGTDPDTGETKFSIIDGQQRIRTIGTFIANQLKLTSSGLEFESKDYLNKTFDALDKDIKSSIWSYKISVRFVKKAVERDSIVKMFLRLNKTANALNPQELRNAEFSGKFLENSARVAALSFWKTHELFSVTDVRRMQDIQFASTLLIFVRTGFEDETTQAAINKMYDLYNENYPEADSDFEKISNTLGVIDQILTHQPGLSNSLKRKTHLYSVFSVIFSLIENKKILEPDNIGKKLLTWFAWTEKTEPVEAAWQEKIGEYRRLSQEGVQKKANRYRRFELLEAYLIAPPTA